MRENFSNPFYRTCYTCYKRGQKHRHPFIYHHLQVATIILSNLSNRLFCHVATRYYNLYSATSKRS